MKPKELEQKESMLDREIQLLEERLEKLELETRSEFDKFRLELTALQRFLENHDPNFKRQFKQVREEVFRNLNPER